MTWILVVLAYAVALAQRPGTVVADTKVHLYVEPARFLADVLSAWTATGDTGHVWAGQYAGYAWPMAPWFTAGDALGLPVWLVHRLWLGTLLALAAVGVVRLLRALVRETPGVVHLVAGLLYVINPYVTVYANRTSVALLAYAALPWLVLAVHRGMQQPRGWRWPAVFALVLTSTAGGINAAVIAFVLLAPAGLVLFELATGRADRRGVGSLVWRLVLVNAVASAWWVIPTLVHAGYGLDFLPYTEQPGTIWGTTSIPESLRLAGFWTSYIGVGYGGELRPFASHGPVLLFGTAVVVAGLLVPALALTSFATMRRLRYAPFFLGLALLGLLLMAAGFPEGTPLRRALTFTYNHVQPAQILRTTYKAGPLLALGLAALGGIGAAWAWAWLGARPRAGRLLAATGGAALLAVAAWPLVTGRALESQLAFEVPPHWTAAADALERGGDDTRALVVPGQLFASYRWGQTIDAILPALSDHPVATRSIVPYADLRAVELQWAVDDLLSQERAVPGQLPGLLDLLGVGDVLLAADGDRSRSGETGPLEVAGALSAQGLRFAPAGAPTRVAPAAGRIAAPRTVPALQRARTRTGGLLRVLPRGPLTVVDGGAAGLVGLAAHAALDPAQPIAYAPDLDAVQLRDAAARGARFVVADGNRRQAFVASRLKGNRGPVLRPDQDVSEDGTMLDPFAAPSGPRRQERQTVATLLGGAVTSVGAPASPQVTQFPENRPEAALDGDPSTAWLADRALAPDRRVLTVRFAAPRDVAAITVVPYSDSHAVVHELTVAGRRFPVGRGLAPQRLGLGLRGVRELRIALSDVRGSRDSAGAGGLRELAIPGVRVGLALRPPVVLERALRGADLSRSSLTYLLSRVTADVPFRQARLRGEATAARLRDAQDPEHQLLRRLTPPVARAWTASGWGRADPRASDAALDRLAGVSGEYEATSSSRFAGLPRHRASGAFDGRSERAWIGQWIPGRAAWLAWRTPRPNTVRELRLTPAAVRVRRPTRVRLVVDGRRGAVLRAAADGTVRLPEAVRGRAFRLDVVAAAFAPGTPAGVRQRRAVGVGELEVAGLPRLRVPRAGVVALGCDSASLGVGGADGVPTRSVGLRAIVDRRALDAGRPVRLRACGAPVALPAGPATVRGLPAPLVVDQLRLEGAAPRTAPASEAVGRVVDPGALGRGERTGAAVAVTGPAWLVHGESFSRGWRATCDGRDLGAPVPMQGYANAWAIDAPGCRALDVAFAPDARLGWARLVSLLGCVVLLLVAGVGARRGRTADAQVRVLLGESPAVTPLPLRRALALGVAASLVLGFVFALRAGAILGPLVALVLWRGIATRTLVLTAGALLGLVVPALYLLFRGQDRGGYSTTYATDHLAAHWVAVAAVGLLLLALARSLSTARGRRDGPAPAPGAAVRRGSAP